MHATLDVLEAMTRWRSHVPSAARTYRSARCTAQTATSWTAKECA